MLKSRVRLYFGKLKSLFKKLSSNIFDLGKGESSRCCYTSSYILLNYIYVKGNPHKSRSSGLVLINSVVLNG